MNRTEILRAAEACITQDRAAIYGPPEDSFGLIAEFWTVFLRARGKLAEGETIEAWDAGMMLGFMKSARATANPQHADNYVDTCGYAGCAGEIAMKGMAND